MALPSSGQISLSEVNTELGNSSSENISIGQSSVRTLFGVPSGAISMSNGYGKSNQFNYTVSANQTNFCMRAGAVSAGWNGTSKLAVTINSGVIISSNGTGTPAMTIQGSFPGTVSVTNNGTIVGRGGNGGNAPNNNNGSPGSAGGTALKVLSTVTFNNTSGIIAGGGGGGGGGGSGTICEPCAGALLGNGGGGGGGRSSNAANSSGGTVSYQDGNPPQPGGSGTYSSAGSGGSGRSVSGWSGSGGSGGPGGNWGATGSSGSSGTPGTYGRSGGAGGGGGKATCGAGSYITWTGTGTRYGSVS